MTTSNEGQLKIYFSELFIIPSNFTTNINNSVLDLNIKSKSGVDPKYLNFLWTTVEYTHQYITIQLNFTYPLYISSKGKT